MLLLVWLIVVNQVLPTSVFCILVLRVEGGGSGSRLHNYLVKAEKLTVYLHYLEIHIPKATQAFMPALAMKLC